MVVSTIIFAIIPLTEDIQGWWYMMCLSPLSCACTCSLGLYTCTDMVTIPYQAVTITWICRDCSSTTIWLAGAEGSSMKSVKYLILIHCLWVVVTTLWYTWTPECLTYRMLQVVGVQHPHAGHEHSQLLWEMLLTKINIILGNAWFATEAGTSIITPIL